MTEQTKDTQATKTSEPKTDVAPKAKKAKKAAKAPTGSGLKKSAKKASPWGRAIVIFFLILIIAAGLTYGGWWLWQQNLAQVSQLQQQNQQLAEQLQAATQKINNLDSANVAFTDSVRAQITEIESLVVSSAQRLNKESDQTENRWTLEEALTLTRLAQRRLFLDKNAAVSISLLRSADDILANLDAAAVLPLREQIAKDILALTSANSVDLNGTYFQLGALASEIRTLNWLPKPTQPIDITPNASPAQGFWESIKQVVVVTRLDSVLQAPPIQSDFEIWRQHTLMLLAQSQLALLAQNQSLYEAALNQAVEQLLVMASQFDFTVLMDQLQQLKSLTLNPVWPDIGTSVSALEAYINQQNELDIEQPQEDDS